ncbi:shikimate kinase [Roseospira marina]|nr:shikimate kinase [Roseospira marina]MBB4314988.1 shikimate kinase [Roseospira marina]MBB5087988.1 shikimate kinase [Roseospira marina]
MTRTVVLVGLMGAGKSCVGRRLAGRLGCAFLDADDEIVKAAGLSVADIFRLYGEAAFRDCERKVMERLLTGTPCVLATGGGAFMDAETRALIQDQAISVWLRADLDTLVSRTAGRTHRPLLNSGDPRAKLQALMTERYPVYAEATVTVDTGPDSADHTTQKVLDALAAHGHAEGKATP